MARIQCPASQRGFTLLEVMTAMALFLIASGGLLAMQVTVARGNAYAGSMAMASNLATATMEGLQTKPTSYLQATWAGEEKYDRYGQLPTSTTYNGDYYTVSWTGQYSGQVIELNVVVSWNLGITKDSTNRTLELRGMVVPNDQ